jgi:hypothetical protein
VSHEAIIRSYRTRNKPRLSLEKAYYQSKNLPEAVEAAARARNANGKKHVHQRWIHPETLENAWQILRRHLPEIAACRNFAELLSTLEGLLAPISGVGELYLYDTALRIGAKLGVSPERVYLHRVTREGAKALSLNYRAGSLSITDFPPPFQHLTGEELEDLLCIYKTHLGESE